MSLPDGQQEQAAEKASSNASKSSADDWDYPPISEPEPRPPLIQVPEITSSEAVTLVNKHLDGLSKLLTLLLPLAAGVLLLLAFTPAPTTIPVFGTSIPAGVAYVWTRILILGIYVQATVHILTTQALLAEHDDGPVQNAIRLHPGPLNPFFVLLTPKLAGPQDRILAVAGIVVGSMNQLAIGAIVGFVDGFRLYYSPGTVGHWLNLIHLVTAPFNKGMSDWAAAEADRYFDAYTGPVTLLRDIDDIVAVGMTGLMIVSGISTLVVLFQATLGAARSAAPALSMVLGWLVFGFISTVWTANIQVAIRLAP